MSTHASQIAPPARGIPMVPARLRTFRDELSSLLPRSNSAQLARLSLILTAEATAVDTLLVAAETRYRHQIPDRTMSQGEPKP